MIADSDAVRAFLANEGAADLRNPADSGCDPSSSSLLCAKDQGSNDRQSFRSSYDTAPLASDATIAGSTEATIQAAFPGTDGHLVVRLSDVAPNGTTTQLATGWQRAAPRDGYDRVSPLRPGQTYAIRVHVYPQFYRVPKGHRLRLSVSSGDLTDALPDNNIGKRIVLATGAGGSYADVPLAYDLSDPRPKAARRKQVG